MSETDIRKGSNNMAKKDIDWNNLGFGYVKTDKRYVSNFKNGAWDDGALIEDRPSLLPSSANRPACSQPLLRKG